MITTDIHGRSYSSDFLSQTEDDLEILASARKRCGGTEKEHSTLRKAAFLIRQIRMENEMGAE